MAVDTEPRVLKHQIVRRSLDAMLDGMSAGDAFPSERDLADRYDVSRETLRQAIRELLVAGRIERRGRATVVAEPKVVLPLAIGSYTEAAREKGMSATRILVGWEVFRADDVLAELLAIEIGSEVVQLERVFTTGDVRVGLETTRIPAYRIPGLQDSFDHRTSLYAELAARGVTFGRVVDTIETVLPDAREAALLTVDTRTPMFLLGRVSYDTDGVPIEHRRSLYRGDRMTFTAVMDA
ncbi:GntR family transcriptional regulator [Rhodococcus sp. 15-725-2-2b]|jgi:GntR family transcriptional regulator|uniref:GntR family transcriptional regulator n=1 Tax=Nocardiaceae TaxID=85025 RepID=UPI00050CABDD|nr:MULTISPECIES: GntR family transcriptional regulator [Rhodococcus]AJW40797.1 putative transcriptional regulator of N-Acetylglucosamine utilization, GntR [Rhodococcus sp. B7740]OZC62986.1 GntR family transcriptional regulator [Rhodococcus sp. 06-469-3-2]OZC67981.1 GntR family transcriptional regulator [Rhodococcus sp. 06-470-2]OZC85112.1 GntR family transcriptional regulator [Rhodococcus sp. 06-418-5]OZC85129.1 GntR family transcriptional regulator [Rhodococcus sp. 06-418-5]